ncbi:tetratricopeptide repeat protein [candidate division KSB1 bacterium]|nr:tetratricopeptide repeat protein [candidate division KSB1 bacterium]
MKKPIFLSGLLIIGMLLNCTHVDRQMDQALDFIRQSDFESALKIYRELITRAPENKRIQNNYGWTLFRADSLESARAQLSQAAEGPKSTAVNQAIQTNLTIVQTFLTIQQQLQQQQPQTALTELTKICRQYNFGEIEYQYLAWTYEALGDTQAVRENWQLVVQLYEHSPVRNHFFKRAFQHLDQMAQAALRSGNYAQASKIYTTVAEVEADSARIFNTLGWALFLNNDLKRAESVLEKARKLSRSKSVRDSVETNLFMAQTFLAGEYSLRQESYRFALNEFQKVTDRYPETDVGLMYLALCFEGLNEKKKADDLWQRIAFLHEGNPYKNKYYQLASQKLKLYL